MTTRFDRPWFERAISVWTTTGSPPGPRSLDHVRQDPSLNDEQLETEIKLVGDLVLAASQAEGPLSEGQIDELLGVAPDDADADATAGHDTAEPADRDAPEPGGRDSLEAPEGQASA